MLAYYKNLFELSLRMAIVEFKVSVGETRLGIFWHLVGPAGMFLVIYGIFSRRLGADIPEYPLYLVFGIIIFRFFQNIISSSVSAVSVKRSVIKSINFPRPALVLSTVLKIIFFHAFDVLVIFLILAWFGHPLILMVWYPLVVGLVALFAFGWAGPGYRTPAGVFTSIPVEVTRGGVVESLDTMRTAGPSLDVVPSLSS